MKTETAVKTKQQLAQEALQDASMPPRDRIKVMTARLSEIINRQLQVSSLLNWDLARESRLLSEEKNRAFASGDDEKIILISKKIRESQKKFTALADELSELSAEKKNLTAKIEELENEIHGLNAPISYAADGVSGAPYQGKGAF